MLWCAVLCCAVLCCAVLRCSALRCAALLPGLARRPNAVRPCARSSATAPLRPCFRRRVQVREEGVQALFKGLAPNYVKVVPSIAIAFVTYEQVGAAAAQLAVSAAAPEAGLPGPPPWESENAPPVGRAALPAPLAHRAPSVPAPPQVKEVLGAEIRLSD